MSGWRSLLMVPALCLLAWSARGLTEVIQVPADYASIAAALEAAPDNAHIEVGPGLYRESLVVERPVKLRSGEAGGAVIASPGDAPAIVIRDTSGVMVEGFAIIGGVYGVFVTRSQDVIIRGNRVSDSRLTGIKVRLGAADIIDNTVVQARPPYGMGIHVTNTTQYPRSRLRGNIVRGNARSGIYTNMTGMIAIEDNIVRGNGEYGIAITETSHADVIGNLVHDNALSGIRLLDMSMALICDNIISDTRGAGAMNMRPGNGITVDFHSEAVLSGNSIFGSAQNGISVLFASSAWLHENRLEQPVFVEGSLVEDGRGCEPGH